MADVEPSNRNYDLLAGFLVGFAKKHRADAKEFKRRRRLYLGVPALAVLVGVSLQWLGGNLWFWRVLAYLAVFHFVRQQWGWVAMYRGHAVHRYTPEGKLDTVVEVPPAQVTACAFGGPGLDELYITTSRENLPAGTDPLAGALFRIKPGVRGLPLGTFAG